MRLKESNMFEKTLMQQFVKCARLYANKDAIRYQEHKITYIDLLKEVVRISNFLRDNFLNEDYVYLEYNQGIEMCIGMFAVLMSGKAYIPIDPSFPIARIKNIVNDTNAHILLTDLNMDRDVISSFEDMSIHIINQDSSIPLIDIDTSDEIILGDDPTSVSYILYTSGSTGQPKGVVQSNENVLFYIERYTQSLGIKFDDNISLISKYTFDAAVMDIFGALLNGATLCIFDRNKDSSNFEHFVKDNQISIFHSVPTLYRIFTKNVQRKESLDSIRAVVLGGETALLSDFQLYKEFFSESCILINGLGPTESTLALQFEADKTTSLSSSTIPVGKPVPGINVYLLDENGKYDINTQYGELVINTNHVALGYINLEEETNKHFCNDLFENSRCYMTGDYLRKNENGIYEFCGRTDSQVKINGIRIEIEEIESALNSHTNIENCVVIPKQIKDTTILLAYYTVRQGLKDIQTSEIIRYISTLIPDSMIPSHFIKVESFPLTSTGKIDRKSLITHDIVNQQVKKSDKGVYSPITIEIIDVWKRLLENDQFDIDTTFKEAGGNSLLMLEMYIEFNEKYNLDIDLMDFSKINTIRKIVNAIESTSEPAE